MKDNNNFLFYTKLNQLVINLAALLLCQAQKGDKIQFLLASHERSHTCTFIVGTMDVPVQDMMFFILIQFIFISEVLGKWVAVVEREELLDTYYEQGMILNHLHNVCTLVTPACH